MSEEAGTGGDSVMTLAQRPIAGQPKNTADFPDRIDALKPLASPSVRPPSPGPRSILNPPPPPPREPSPIAPRLMAPSGAATPQNKPGTASPSNKSTDAQRPLNVTDALSYLDAVKNQFSAQPEVYNRFLDIMKDFKSQAIDTPGVIQRVSQLFHGNHILIQGFNTFLPLGYRIDVSRNPEEPHTITVTTPQGTTTQNTGYLPPIARDIPGLGPNIAHPGPFAGMGGPAPVLPPLGSGPGSRSLTPAYHHPPPHPPPFDPPPYLSNPQTTAAASFLGNLNNRNPIEKQQSSGEFNHAIQYLNKIKARYADDPNTYKQFLDILQTYQKEQKHLQDSQVYVQVQHLFKDAPDLLGEFKAFLPEISGGQNMVVLPQPPSVWPQSEVVDKALKKSVQPAKRKKRILEKDPTPVPQSKPAQRPTKKPKHHHKPEPGSPSSFTAYLGHSPPPATMSQSAMPTFQHQSMAPPLNMTGVGTTSADKLLFFDRAKKTLENRQMYEDFLKLLGLFSKEIIDMKTLIDRTRDGFLGDGGLMDEFKELVGWEDSSDEKGPPGSVRTGPPEALLALPADDGEGPSYRRLPESESRLACSGRDELCRSVLNDGWVSHPTWASEDAGFVSHKKNSFEEALHKSEEERHEYHVQIAALTRTIAHFEPLAMRIEEMSADERATFRLKSDFGGSGKYLYHRIIKKIYGRDGGMEIIQALQDAPAVAVPVVLGRLKQKDDEWRRAQREWARTWREVDAKNFYKSLDHQGISFKQNDKKNITAKHFVADIEALKAAQDHSWTRKGAAPAQLEYSFADTPVLHDALKMVYSFLDHSQAQYSAPERRSIESFLRRFVPLLCMYPAAEFNAACGPLDGVLQQEEEQAHAAEHAASRSGRRSNGSVYSPSNGMGVAAGDLRKKLLRTVQDKNESNAASRAMSPAPDDAEIWIKRATHVVLDAVNGNASHSRRPFFTNTTFYTLLRLIQLLYSRLEMCKAIGAKLAAEKHASLLVNPVAAALGLDDPAGPPVVLAQTVLPLAVKEAAGDELPNVVYMYLLDACEKVFDNELDQATFEEHMRWFFGEKAYHLFTIDKVIMALVKQVQTIVGDNKCQELWTLLQSTNASATDGVVLSDSDIVRYRREAERHVGQDDHLYRLEWVRDMRTMRVSLMGPEDPSVDGGDRWKEYVTTYVMRLPTEWVPPGPVDEDGERIAPSVTFLKRNRRISDARAVVGDDTMCVRIERPTYKLVYEAGAEDLVWWPRARTASWETRARAAAERREARLAERYS
ncbi:histone deacetylase complex, SIN3 component [Mycena pura]|uniref:Histone deacetylase complex, SIN3 component n=1 Tax=Mycena pura TaxID=153505 RepID=A0AAD6Y4U0_9AGAR|nr:histone deacetylase complex, SIN3 component [Mycena pura]